MISQSEALRRIRQTERETLTPAEVAAVIGCRPYYINVTAMKHPDRLPFPVFFVGTHCKIPKTQFLNYWENRNEDFAQ